MSSFNLKDNLEDRLIEFLHGTLLGDGTLFSQTNGKSVKYQISQKHKGYLEWISSFLNKYGILQSGKIYHRKGKRFDTIIENYQYHSKTYRGDITSIYEKWYPDGKKIVPNGVRLTPFSVRHWFIEDGCYKLPRGNRCGEIVFSTQGFDRKYIYYLKEKLCKVLGTKRIYVDSAGRIFFGSRKTVNTFFDYVDELPKVLRKDYGYKWPSNNTV